MSSHPFHGDIISGEKYYVDEGGDPSERTVAASSGGYSSYRTDTASLQSSEHSTVYKPQGPQGPPGLHSSYAGPGGVGTMGRITHTYETPAGPS